MGLSDDEIEDLDLAKFSALEKRITEREKRADIRIAKLQYSIYTAMCGPEWSNGTTIKVTDFLPDENAESTEEDNTAQLRAQLEMMARRG